MTFVVNGKLSKKGLWMTDRQTSQLLGLNKDALSKLKKSDIAQYNFIASFAPTMLEAYPLYQEYKETVSEEARCIYTLLEDTRQKIPFGTFLVEKGIYKSVSYYTKTEDMIFSKDGIKRFGAMLKIIQSNNLFEEFNQIKSYQ